MGDDSTIGLRTLAVRRVFSGIYWDAEIRLTANVAESCGRSYDLLLKVRSEILPTRMRAVTLHSVPPFFYWRALCQEIGEMVIEIIALVMTFSVFVAVLAQLLHGAGKK